MNLDLEKLKIAQARACLSVNDLVDETGLVRSTISKVLNGRINPKPKTLGRIAKALNVNIEDIILQE